jgi:hypothetical protein
MAVRTRLNLTLYVRCLSCSNQKNALCKVGVLSHGLRHVQCCYSVHIFPKFLKSTLSVKSLADTLNSDDICYGRHHFMGLVQHVYAQQAYFYLGQG